MDAPLYCNENTYPPSTVPILSGIGCLGGQSRLAKWTRPDQWRMAPERPRRTMRRPPKGQKRPSYRKGESLRWTDTIHGIGNDVDAVAQWCVFINLLSTLYKVKQILKGSLDSIPSPSPSVKIQIMGRKVCLRCKGKTLLGVVNKL